MQCIILCMALNDDEWSFSFTLKNSGNKYVSDEIRTCVKVLNLIPKKTFKRRETSLNPKQARVNVSGSCLRGKCTAF